MKHKVLCIDDNADFLYSMKLNLRDDYDFATVSNKKDALAFLKNNAVDLILLDVNLGDNLGENLGFDLLEIIKKSYPDVTVFMLSGYKDPDLIVRAINKGAANYLIKGTKYEELRAHINKELKNSCLKKDYIHLKEKHEALVEVNSGNSLLRNCVGKSKSFQQLIKQVRKLKNITTNILIEGESGTGKEVVASMLYRQEQNSNRPFIKVNCAAIQPNLVESELFGHEKGAFTGAIKKKIGQFELAHGGDIFLDEINSLPLELQAKLLRVLQENSFHRVGGTENIKVDIRVIAASNVPLEQLVEEGKFRDDLLYRLNVISLHVPPLRERKEDIPQLCEHFLKKRSQNGVMKKFLPEAIKALMQYNWPGNIRELEHVVQNLVITSESEMIQDFEVFALTNKRFNKTKSNESDSSKKLPDPEKWFLNFLCDKVGQTKSLKEVLNKVEKQYVKRAYHHFEGNITRTASALGVGRQRIYENLKFN